MGFHLFGFYFGKKKDDIDFSCAYTVRDDQPDILFHTILNIEGCKKHKIQVKIYSDNSSVVGFIADPNGIETGILRFGRPGKANIICNIYKQYHLVKSFKTTFIVLGGDAVKFTLIPGIPINQ